MKLLTFSLLFILFGPLAFSQPASRYPAVGDLGGEQIFVQLNSTFLLTGETLYFKIFCKQLKNDKPTLLSKIAYLELVDEGGTPVYQTKVSLQKGSGYGDFFIPSTFSSGNYSLVAYTQWMKNFGNDSFFTKRLVIVNPFNLTMAVAAGSGKKVSPENIPIRPQSNDIKLKLSGDAFRTREKVSITLSAGAMTRVCVSVRKKESALDDAGTMLKNGATDVTPNKNPEEMKLASEAIETIFLPEIRGHLITGQLTAKDKEVSKQIILGSIPGSGFVFRAATIDQHGNFVMIVDRIPESSAMFFQVLDDDVSAYTIKINDPFLSDYSKFRPEPMTIDTGVLRIIGERNVFTQIENAYYETKEDSVSLRSWTSFYNVPDKKYRLDDFTRFPTMEDIFREYVPEVIVKRSRDVFSLQIVNPRTGFPYSKEPLLLIDGVPILSTNTLMAYDPLKVELVEIVQEKYFYGALESDGIISFKTYKGAIGDLPTFPAHRENLVKIQSGGVYSFPDYTLDKLKLERVPDYRLQLYWNPDLDIKEGNATVDFYTSDVPGNFEVIVEGFLSNGELVTTREVFSVPK